MDKAFATLRLGGEVQAARWIGVTPAIYRSWPERLHPIMRDRVIAATMRQGMARALELTPRQFYADARGEVALEGMLMRVSFAAIMASFLARLPRQYMRDAEPDEPPGDEPDEPDERASLSRPYTRKNGPELAGAA